MSIKLDVTPAQLKAIKELGDYASSVYGSCDEEAADWFYKCAKHIDNMLKRNNLPPRDYN